MTQAIDIARVRADTPSVTQTVHFDNAGASPTANATHLRVVRHLERERLIGGYAASREAEAELDGFADSVAGLINAQPNEIAFAESATHAWERVFHAIEFSPGDRIIAGRSEYASSYISYLRAAEKWGVTIDLVPDGEDGAVDVGALANMLDDRVRLVSICHVPTSNGLRNDAVAVGSALRGHPALYLLDACQSAGQLEIDVAQIGCHMLSATGRKFLRGPRGTGFLYVAASALDRLNPALVDMRGADWTAMSGYRLRPDARRFESWESPVASKLGFKTAIDYAQRIGVGAIEARVTMLADALRDELASVRGVTLRDRGTQRSGIVTFTLDGWDAVMVRDQLTRENVAVSAIELGDARLDLEPDGIRAVVRASIHYYNIEDEIADFCSRVERLAATGAD